VYVRVHVPRHLLAERQGEVVAQAGVLRREAAARANQLLVQRGSGRVHGRAGGGYVDAANDALHGNTREDATHSREEHHQHFVDDGLGRGIGRRSL